MDIFSAIIVVVPLINPIAAEFGIDPIHLAIIFLTNLEIGYITPPVGINLYVLRGIVPEDIKTSDIFRAVLPFVCLQATGLAIVMIFPQLALYIPATMRG